MALGSKLADAIGSRPVRDGPDFRPQDAAYDATVRAHLSPDYMAGTVGKLDGIMGGMLAASIEH